MRYSRIYVDNRLHYMLALTIKESFWDRGDFPEVVNNGSDYIVLKDPWVNGTLAAPFDKRKYLFWAVPNREKLRRRLVQPFT